MTEKEYLVQHYYIFLKNFIENAKEMDAEEATFIDNNYIDLLARC